MLKLNSEPIGYKQTFTGSFWLFITEITYDFTYEIYVGWRVEQVAVDYGYYNFTYVPYARAEVSTGATTSTTVFEGGLQANSTVFRTELPITVQYEFNEFNVCYQGDLFYYDPLALISAKSSVLECYQDVEEAMRTGDYNVNCDYNSPLYLSLFNNTETASYTTQSVVDRTCWTIA